MRGAGGGEVELGIRPEHLHLTNPGEGQLPGTVSVVENLGNTAYVYLDTPAGPVVAEADPSVRSEPGMAVGLRFDPIRTHVFDRQEGTAWPLAA
jgi:ABC-type sugar transport system ATPase subunit